MELDARVIAADVELNTRFFQAALAPRLDRVLKLDLVRVAPLDVNIAYAEAHVQVATRDEIATVGMTLFIFPIISRTQRNQQQTQQGDLIHGGNADRTKL